MAAVKIGSREYKIMLKADRFAGDESQLLAAAQAFWREGTKTFGPAVRFISGDLAVIKDNRLIRFYDTSDHYLNRNAYIFRERVDLSGKKREVTLKFRHPDRFIARHRDMRGNGKSKTKFEEDIKPPFQQLYSYSTTQPLAADAEIARLRDILKLYPGLRSSLTGFTADEPLTLVDNFTAREVVIAGSGLHLGKKFNVSASCVLVIWYDHDSRGDTPVVAEFSFKYGDNREAYGGGTVRRAYEAFRLMQTELDEWTDRESKTKTACVYS
jgi:hypothetical protein